MVGFAPASTFWLAVAGMFVMGFMNPIINGPIFALLQSTVDPDKQGRVFTLTLALAGAFAPLGLAVAGPLASHFGIELWFIVGGIALLLAALAGVSIPDVLHIDEGRNWRAYQPQSVRPVEGRREAATAPVIVD